MPDTPPITFTDGAAYETMMGVWSGLAGNVFLDWVAPAPGLRWADIGCGNGAFTELIATRCAPAAIDAIDPSEEQLEFASERALAKPAEFYLGPANPLPFADAAYDTAVMALVIFFVPEPAKGVAEMARVLRPGGVASAYAWDILGGGFPWEAFWAQQRDFGLVPRQPPSVAASTLPAMRALWEGAGFVDVETREITVERSFADFDEYWRIGQSAPGTAALLAQMGEADAGRFMRQLRKRVPADASGKITLTAHANAVKGRLPD